MRNPSLSQPATRRRSWLQLVRDAQDAEELYLLLNSSWPREPCGTRGASAVPSASVHWTRPWLAMDPIRRSIADRATLSSSDPRDSAMATPRLLCPPLENKPLPSMFYQCVIFNIHQLISLIFQTVPTAALLVDLRLLMDPDACVADSQFMLLNR